MKEIKIAMINRGMNYKQLAAATGLSYASLMYLMNGQKKPNWSTIRKIQKALSLSPEEVGRIFFSN